MKTAYKIGIVCITSIVLCITGLVVLEIWLFQTPPPPSYESIISVATECGAVPPGIEVTNIYYKYTFDGPDIIYEMKGFNSNTWNYISKQYKRESYTDGIKKYIFPEANLSHMTNKVIAVYQNYSYEKGYDNYYIVCSNNIAYLMIIKF